MSLLSSSRCVLMLADEGVHLYRTSSLGVKYVDHVTWDDENFVGKVSTLIVTKCAKKPVVIVYDMVEQHYRKEKLPKVSPVDKSAVVKRRLNVAFPNYPIRAALKTKEQEKGAGHGGNYLFAAIPQSDAYKKTISAVQRSTAPIVGLYLLPVEGTTMVSKLSQNQAKKAKTKAAWTIFIGQHHGGGLRQIVTKNGDLALTRMTPVVDTDVEPDVWVKEVTSELQSTMSYLARFGYKQEDGLDIFIVANESTQTMLEENIDVPSNLYCLNSVEMANLLGIKIGRQEELRYADALHAGWQAKQRKFVLPMQNQSIDRLTKPRQIASAVAAVSVFGAAYMGYATFTSWSSLATSQGELSSLEMEAQSLETEYKTLLSERVIDGYDYLLVNNAIKLYDQFDSKKKELLPVMAAIGTYLGPNVKADKITAALKKDNSTNTGNVYSYDSSNTVVAMLLDVTVDLSFSDSVNTDAAVNKVNSLVIDLGNELSDFDVIIEKQIGGVSYSENLVEEIGGSVPTDSGTDAKTAVIVIREKAPVQEEIY